MNRFIIADLHLGHEKIALARGFTSVEEHDECIIDNWNKVVNKRSSVFVLGDVVFGQSNLSKLARLNGTKKLVLGNHDKYPITAYLPYFSQIYGCVRFQGCVLTHIPVHESQFARYKKNIHGHLHSKRVQVGEVDDLRYICVSAEQTGLKPLAWEELILDV